MPCPRVVVPVRMFLSILVCQLFSLVAQTLPDRIASPVDDNVRVALRGNTHPLARPEYEVGVAAPDRRMERMILTLGTDAGRERSLEALLRNQQDPRSAEYHQWLTPAEFGQQFGVSGHDLAEVANWLRGHGLAVDEIAPGGRSILFSGDAAQVQAAFHTEIRAYNVGGETHYANATDPEIPRVLTGVVQGVVALHDFRSQPAHALLRPISRPELTSGSVHFLAPADFATIYDAAPLYQNSIDGTGQSVAVVARCNIHLSDVQAFRSYFGLAANNPSVIVNGADPGIVSVNEQTEAELDAEWAGAVAKNASVQFVVSASTNASDGSMLSAQYIVTNNVAPVMTMSFGLCEAALGSSANSFLNNLWQQAAAEGITVLIAAGDSGAAGCDSPSAATAGNGPAVNGICSTPYSTCVGGTQFNDSANPSAYWSGTSDPTTKVSALQYIPELVWNESGTMPGGLNLWSGGGGASSIYAKPLWQTGPGVPADGMRDVPDVSVTAASHDGYAIYLNNQLCAVAGTSASAPSLAGVMAMVVEKTGARQGNVNPVLYSLAASQQSGGAAVFHDVTIGTNSVPGVTGFNAGAGYDQGSGVGSVDAAMLVNNWPTALSGPGLQVNLSSASIAMAQGAGAGVNVTLGVSGGFHSTVLLSVTGLPAGVTASFAPASLAAPGSGVSALSLNASSQMVAGSYSIQVTANGGTVTQNASLNLTVTPPAGFALTVATPSVTLAQGGVAMAGVNVAVSGGFSNAIVLSATGLPAGLTANFAPARVAAPGSGASTLTLSATSQAVAGNYTVQVTANGGTVTQNASLNVTIALPGSFTLGLSASSVSVKQNASMMVGVGVSVSGGFNNAVALSAMGLPAGVTAGFTPASLTAPGSGASALLVRAGPQAVAGSYPIEITATGGGITQTQALTVTVLPQPGFTLSETTGSVSIVQGTSTSVAINVAVSGGFNAKMTLAVAGQTGGMAVKLSATGFAVPGSGTSTLALTTTAQTGVGVYTMQVTAGGGGLTGTLPLIVTVAPPPTLAISAGAPSVSLAQGGNAGVSLNVAGANGFNAPVTLSASGLGNGVTASFSPASFAAPGSGASVLAFAASAGATTGSRTVLITATAGGVTKTTTLAVTVNPPPTFTWSAGAASVRVAEGGTAAVGLAVTGATGFNANVTLSASGLPTGVTASFLPQVVAAPGSGMSVLTLTAASNTATGSRAITITAIGGGVTKTMSVTVTVTPPPAFTLGESVATATIARGSSASLNLSLSETGGFNSSVTVSVSGLPQGVGATFSNPSFSGGTYTLPLKLAAASNATVGSYTLTITATGGAIAHAVTFALKTK
jgi:pseudomonalisin